MVARPATIPITTPAVERMRRLAQAALVVLTGFLASRILGVVRSIVIAAHFGTGTEASAYVAAIAVPDTVFQVLVGGAVGSAFIPVFQRLLADDQESDAWRMTSSVINLGVLVAGGTALVLAIFARPVMDVLAAGRDPEFRELAANLSRILLITPAVFAASTFCASVLNSYHRFAVAALAPLMYNLAIIAGAFFLSGPFGIQGLAIGAAVGAVLHLLVQVPALIRLGDEMAADHRSAQHRRARGGPAVRAARPRAGRCPVQQGPLGSAVRVIPDHRQHGLPGLCVADDHDAAGAGDGHRNRGLSDAVRGQRTRSSRATPAGLSSVAAHDPVSDHSGQYRAHGAG